MTEITAPGVLKELAAALKQKSFQIETNTSGPFLAIYKERPECVHLFYDSTKIIIFIGNDKYALSKEQRDIIMMEHEGFFCANPYGGIGKTIPIDPNFCLDAEEMADKIEKVMASL